MSRIGRTPIPLNNTVKAELKGQTVTVTGSKGTLTQTVTAAIEVQVSDNEITVIAKENTKEARSLHGLSRSLINNMVVGVEKGFQKQLEIHGVGYRAQAQGKKLVLSLGYSHPIEYKIPDGVSVAVTDNTKIAVEGIDKQQVGQVAAEIRDFRKPEPYKGKGVRYVGEQIAMKEGKTV